MTPRLRHRLRGDTAAPAPQPGGETRKCSRRACGPGRAAAAPLSGPCWRGDLSGLALPGVDPALRPGGAGLHSPPPPASWRKERRAELGRGSRCRVPDPPPRGPPLPICPGRGRSPSCCPLGLPYLITRRASPDPVSSPPQPPSRRASRGLERRLGVGGPWGPGLNAALGPATPVRSAGAPGLLTPGTRGEE